MHALIINGAVAKYPYSIGMLRKDNPNTSFPKRPSDELLAEWNMQPVAKVDRPEVDHTQNVNEGTPVLVGDQWTQVWNVIDASPAEIADRVAAKSEDVRKVRAELLAETDWMALSDTTLSPEWAAYRQALRDITSHANFPYLDAADWPVKPE